MDNQEIRKDYIEDQWVIINPKRGKRPHQFEAPKQPAHDRNTCFFCPGNESLTPPEIWRIEGNDGNWTMRWFDNKFAVVKPEGNPEVRTDNTYFTFSDAYGKHEVIVETNDPEKQLWDLEEKEIRQLFDVYKGRIGELSKLPNIKYVSVFKNHGRSAGTSIVHSHSQVIAYSLVPNKILNMLNAVRRFDHCPYCDIIRIERGSYRRVWEDEHFAAFCPYASRFNYEIWVFPKRHVSSLNELDENELTSLSRVMKHILLKLKGIGAEFNYFLNYSHDSDELHFHIRINPRIAVWAGFEWSTDTIINSVSPEDAAKFYRGGG